MDLTKLSAAPTLVKVTIDDKETVKEFGEALEFWTWDRQPLNTYLSLNAAMSDDQDKAVELLKTLVLDPEGNPIMAGDKILPAKIMVKAMTQVMALLGK